MTENAWTMRKNDASVDRADAFFSKKEDAL